MRRAVRLRRGPLAITALVALAVVVGCGAPPPSGSTSATTGPIDPNGRLVVGTIAVPTGFDPHRERTAGERPYTYLVFDRLTKLDESLRPQPMLATRWEFSADGRSMTMDLRAGVSFHDGTPFDANAVKANIERAKTLEGSTSADELAAVQAVEVVSPTQVRFVLSRPAPELPEMLAGPPGAMISPKAISDPAVDLLKNPGQAGTGPYVVDTFVPSERVVFKRAPGTNWDPEAGRLSELEIRFVADDRTRTSALRAGELDISYVNPIDASAIKEAEALGRSGDFVYHRSPTGVLQALLLRSTLLSDPRVRQAIVHAVDRNAVANGVLQSTCVRSDQFAREGFPGHVPGFTDPYPYNPDKARQLLADAGLAGGMDLDIFFIAGRPQIPELLQQQLGQVGIRAKLTPLTSVEVLTAYRQDQAQTWNYQVTPETSLAASVDWMLSSAGLGGKSDAVAAALAKARVIVDDAERERAYHDVMRAVANEAFFVPYCHIDAHYLLSKKVIGFDTAPVRNAQFTIDLRYVAAAQMS